MIIPGRPFAQRLAREFGRLDVDGMLLELSCSQFDAWFAFYQDNLFQDELQKFMLGQVAAATYNASERYNSLFSADDFYPMAKPKQPKSVSEQIAIWRSL